MGSNVISSSSPSQSSNVQEPETPETLKPLKPLKLFPQSQKLPSPGGSEGRNSIIFVVSRNLHVSVRQYISRQRSIQTMKSTSCTSMKLPVSSNISLLSTKSLKLTLRQFPRNTKTLRKSFPRTKRTSCLQTMAPWIITSISKKALNQSSVLSTTSPRPNSKFSKNTSMRISERDLSVRPRLRSAPLFSSSRSPMAPYVCASIIALSTV